MLNTYIMYVLPDDCFDECMTMTPPAPRPPILLCEDNSNLHYKLQNESAHAAKIWALWQWFLFTLLMRVKCKTVSFQLIVLFDELIHNCLILVFKIRNLMNSRCVYENMTRTQKKE